MHPAEVVVSTIQLTSGNIPTSLFGDLLKAFLRYEPEFNVRVRAEGSSLAFGAAISFPYSQIINLPHNPACVVPLIFRYCPKLQRGRSEAPQRPGRNAWASTVSNRHGETDAV